MRPVKKVRMKEVREKLDTFGDSRTWARKVCVRVDSDDFGALGRRKRARRLRGLLQSQAARRNHDDLGRSSRD